MLSDDQVKLTASNFVAIKIDPRKSEDALEHKQTRYVPELIVLDPSQNFIAQIDAFDPTAMVEQLQEALDASRRSRPAPR